MHNKTGVNHPSIMNKPKQEITMKTLITTLLLIVMTTTAQANTITPVEPKCTNTDLTIGIVGGVATAVVTGVATVASMPLVGAGVAAGSTVGWAGAFSAPFLTKATASVVAASVALGGPIYSTVGYYASCVVNTVRDK